MTLLHTQFQSGAMFTVGNSGPDVGISGINDITGRINFGGYQFPKAENITFTTGSFDFVEKIITSGVDHYWEDDITYSNYAKPTLIVTSGDSIGSIITTSLYYETGSGLTATGSLSTGSITFS